ncbi:MAG: ROK family protein [bacterium]|nr:ROK family protein [bacterium]
MIAEMCRNCLAAPAAAGRPLVGIGVALPCPVDPSHPDRLSTIVLPAWDARLGLDALSAQYGVPLMVDNDANLGALAEHWWGVGRGVDDLAYIKVAMGIGSGHVIGGEIYRGATGVAGEIGHLSIDPQGKPLHLRTPGLPRHAGRRAARSWPGPPNWGPPIRAVV